VRLMSNSDVPVLEWAWAGAALDGAAESGDLHVVMPLPSGALVAVIDGLGHGPEAAEASREAAEILHVQSRLPLPELFECCHEGLRKTRGVVLSLVVLDVPSSTIEWFGVGNVEAVLLRSEPGGARSRQAITARGGVLGYRMPPLKASRVAIAAGDLLVMATDGLRSGFADDIELDWEPQAIADWLLSKYARGTDDALVLVARYLGGRP